MTYPTVSIILPFRDKFDNLRRALASWANLDYPAGLVEMILVDDGSQNPEQVADLRAGKYIRLENEAHRTPTKSWMAGKRIAEGEFIVFAMQDCIVSTKQILKNMIHGYVGRRECVQTLFLTAEWTAALDRIAWQPDPSVIERLDGFWDTVVWDYLNNRDRRGHADITSYITANYRSAWDWFGWFRDDDSSHLYCDQDLHMREKRLKMTASTVPDTYAYHQWHERGVWPTHRMAGPAYRYDTERQARLLEPAPEDK